MIDIIDGTPNYAAATSCKRVIRKSASNSEVIMHLSASIDSDSKNASHVSRWYHDGSHGSHMIQQLQRPEMA